MFMRMTQTPKAIRLLRLSMYSDNSKRKCQRSEPTLSCFQTKGRLQRFHQNIKTEDVIICARQRLKYSYPSIPKYEE